MSLEPGINPTPAGSNSRVPLTAVLPTTAVKYLGIRLTMHNDSAAQVRACSVQFYAWIASLRRSRFPGPMIREMARAKIGGFLGYSFPTSTSPTRPSSNGNARWTPYCETKNG